MRMKQIMAAFLCFFLAAAMLYANAAKPLGTPQEEIDSFFSAFTLVPENPLPGDLSWLLWLISQEAPQEAATTELSPLQLASAKFSVLISDVGVYYEETTSFMGMDMRSEYWMKGEKLKKHDHTSDEVILLDGTWFYKYSPGKKTGIRLAPDHPDAAFAVTMIKNSMLPALAASPYQQQEDTTEGGFDCQVFYLDIDMMGMKGNWLYVDKATGAMVKYQFGDSKNGMSTFLTKLETGTFGNEAFMLPENVELTGP